MFRMKVKTDNSAFHGDLSFRDRNKDDYFKAYEIKRIMESVCHDMMAGSSEGKCLDINGNVVGKWEVD